jgi:hypothetical protein
MKRNGLCVLLMLLTFLMQIESRTIPHHNKPVEADFQDRSIIAVRGSGSAVQEHYPKILVGLVA